MTSVNRPFCLPAFYRTRKEIGMMPASNQGSFGPGRPERQTGPGPVARIFGKIYSSARTGAATGRSFSPQHRIFSKIQEGINSGNQVNRLRNSSGQRPGKQSVQPVQPAQPVQPKAPLLEYRGTERLYHKMKSKCDTFGGDQGIPKLRTAARSPVFRSRSK
jgi:hypothetical protein